ncbi:MAG: hypothetical protein NZ889_01050 [Candidatus Pacearchaeota archaeon]|nr:hypothetical protein [Candidatus Pacearchaeota archaeon]
MKKRAISPIVATVLLIVVAIALFLMIFFWLRGFQKEAIMKMGTAIENVCPKIKFEVRKTTTGQQQTITIINAGDVTIQGFKIIVKEQRQELRTLFPGEIGSVSISNCENGIKIVPVLRGKTSTGYKDHICEEQTKIIPC